MERLSLLPGKNLQKGPEIHCGPLVDAATKKILDDMESLKLP